MSKVVYKYPLHSHVYNVALPSGAEVLCAKVQNGDICIWALVDPAIRDADARRFLVVGTGQELPEQELKYIDTVLLEQGQWVFHVFEEL